MLQRWRRGRWLKHAKRVQAEAARQPLRQHSSTFT